MYIFGKNVVSLILGVSLLFPYLNSVLGIEIDKIGNTVNAEYIGNPQQEYFERYVCKRYF